MDKPHHLQQLVGAAFRGRVRQTKERGVVHQCFTRSQKFMKVRHFGQIPETGLDSNIFRTAAIKEFYRAGCRTQKPQQHLKRGAFA